MPRCTFIWLDANGNPDATKNVNLMSVTRDGGAHSTTFVAIGDGSYYFTYTLTGEYTISYNGTEQDEFKNMQLPGSDLLVTGNLAASPIRGQITGDELHVYTDGASIILISGDLVTNLTTNDATKPAAANTVYDLKALIDALAGTGIGISDAGGYFDASDVEDALQEVAALLGAGLTQSYSQENVIDDTKTIIQNLDRIDVFLGNAVNKSKAGARTIVPDFNVAGFSNNDAASSTDNVWQQSSIVSNPGVIKLRIPFNKRATDRKLILTALCQQDVGGSGVMTVTVGGFTGYSNEITSSGYDNFSAELDISELDNGIHIMEIGLWQKNGASILQMKSPAIHIISQSAIEEAARRGIFTKPEF